MIWYDMILYHMILLFMVEIINLPSTSPTITTTSFAGKRRLEGSVEGPLEAGKRAEEVRPRQARRGNSS